ncbi:beta-ketoacyl synthase N-terminal-like domain-containing protein [Actinomadura opuntiae]|uniref:beta-ketoacyl synthase N-terminal-like domain-containing protein n=1 Tax=Actinomadura sp. OS1-43 TaxID=604315 RepID=UPI00255A7110|nr:beta-ketoacyl synthase N-terminal-like domain-containing protein [Actinomadura sp. OS1-43]MDL4820279.1 beta-ketoacyl synthase N-terminal-like domain-containing protein [Actinomadura sp. OS1-43]
MTGAGIGMGIAGWSVLSAGPAKVAELYDEPLPGPVGHALTGFDARARLGRKGTGSYDRVTALAVVCCQEALRDAGTAVDDAARTRIGVALGTTMGSFKSTSDYSRETLVQERPYLVNPLLFPNTVMNCAAGQVAIRFGLKAVNATIAGGPVAFLNALRYAGNAIGRGYADVMLTGAAEEFTPHRAWAARLTGPDGAFEPGEGAGVFVLAGPRAPAWAGPRRPAGILAVATGYGPGGDPDGRALAGCAERALARAGVRPAEVAAVVTGEGSDADRGEFAPVARVLGREPERVPAKRDAGDCDAASPALGLGALLASGRLDGGEVALLTARGADGAAGVAVVRGGPAGNGKGAAGAGTDHG